MRAGLVVALLLGLGDLTGWFPFSPTVLAVHIAAGVAVLVGIARLAARAEAHAARRLWIALTLAVIGAGFGLALRISGGPYDGLIHLALMLVAVGLAEMRAGRPARSESAQDA